MRLILIAALLATAASAERFSLKPVADTYIYATPWNSAKMEDSEAFQNHGGESQLVVKGREYFSLLQFDLSAIKGMTVSKASLRLHLNPNSWPLSTMGLSTISGSGPWAEKTANYFFARTRDLPWAYAGSEFSDVSFGLGGSLYTYLKPRDVGNGYWELDIPPAFVYALSTGDQFGWALSDEKGQTWARYSLSSREQAQWPPVLTIEATRQDVALPGPVHPMQPAEPRALGRTTLRPGSVILHFGGSGDAARYELRYSMKPIDAGNFEQATLVPRWMMDPTTPKPHPLAISNSLRDEVHAIIEQLQPGARYYFAVRAYNKAGYAGPVSALGRFTAYDRQFPKLAKIPAAPQQKQKALAPDVWAVPELLKIDPLTGSLLEKSDFPDHRSANAVWSASTSTVQLSGVRNEFVAFQLAIESPKPLSSIELAVMDPVFAKNSLPEVFERTGAVQLYREWFVPDGDKWFPDPLVPLSSPVDLPSRDNSVPGQTVQPFFVDVYIPKDAATGIHKGRLLITAAGGFRREIKLEIDVLPLTLPDNLNFTVDLNAYGGVNDGYRIRRGTDEYRTLVRSYHRLAHLHRTNLDVLGYSHSGSVEPDYSPPLSGEGAETKVASWRDWDAHFGPLVDGSAFTDLPRTGVPVPNLYLNFFEAWPGDIHANYKWDNYPRATTAAEYKNLIARHGLEAGPIEDGFSQSYQDRFSAVVRDFAEHFRSRGWLGTRYLVYLNDKHFYKDPAKGARGTSWWLLDEPNTRDDFRAISFFGWLAKRRLSDYPDVPIVFRTDISYVDFMRDLLTGQVDLNTVSKRFLTRNRFLMDHRDRFGAQFWQYASTNHPRETNVSMRVWCWRVWTAGGDGVVPWNAVKGDGAWDKAEPLTVFYPGSKFGRNEPFASLRLKAYRRGQQDIEYLVLLAGKQGWDREAVGNAVAGALDFSGDARNSSDLDAGSVTFEHVHDADLDKIRLRVARTLAGN